MEKEFVPYKQALELKELGFDENCLARFDGGGFKMLPRYDPLKNSEIKEIWYCVTPLYQQIFRWFREKHNLSGVPDDQSYSIWKLFQGERDCIREVYPLNNFEEAESACINKLIEIVKNK